MGARPKTVHIKLFQISRGFCVVESIHVTRLTAFEKSQPKRSIDIPKKSLMHCLAQLSCKCHACSSGALPIG
jgi:hypothetical protein